MGEAHMGFFAAIQMFKMAVMWNLGVICGCPSRQMCQWKSLILFSERTPLTDLRLFGKRATKFLDSVDGTGSVPHSVAQANYGSPRIHKVLQNQGIETSLSTFAKIMQEN